MWQAELKGASMSDKGPTTFGQRPRREPWRVVTIQPDRPVKPGLHSTPRKAMFFRLVIGFELLSKL